MSESLPSGAIEWLRCLVGPFETTRNFRAGNGRTGVWLIRAARGDLVIKLHFRRSHWEAERFAYQAWADSIAPYSPTLLTADEGMLALLLTYVEGTPLRESEVVDESIAYRKAGQLLKQINEVARGDRYGLPGAKAEVRDRRGNAGGTHFTEAPNVRADDLSEMVLEGEKLGSISARRARSMRSAAEDLRESTPQLAIPSHSDYTPGNWLVHANGGFSSVIDFENVSWGHPVDSWIRLVLDYFPGHEECRKAFCDGYGKDVARIYPEWTRVGCYIYAGYYAAMAVKTSCEKDLLRSERAFALLGD